MPRGVQRPRHGRRASSPDHALCDRASPTPQVRRHWRRNDRHDSDVLDHILRIVLVGQRALCWEADPAFLFKKTSNLIAIPHCASSSLRRRSNSAFYLAGCHRGRRFWFKILWSLTVTRSAPSDSQGNEPASVDSCNTNADGKLERSPGSRVPTTRRMASGTWMSWNRRPLPSRDHFGEPVKADEERVSGKGSLPMDSPDNGRLIRVPHRSWERTSGGLEYAAPVLRRSTSARRSPR